MHLGDGIFIFILALVLLGPKKTSELANQLGKLMGEFRKASNDFKFQFNEEMRVSEQQERQKKQDAERVALAASTPVALPEPDNTILPPSENSPQPEAVPYAVSAVSATTGEEHPVDDHPLLRVDVIPPMDGSPADQTSATEVTPTKNGHKPEQAEAQQAEPQPTDLTREEDGAPVHHG